MPPNPAVEPLPVSLLKTFFCYEWLFLCRTQQDPSSSNPSPAHPAPAVVQSKGVSDQLRRLLRLLVWRHCGKHFLWRARPSRH